MEAFNENRVIRKNKTVRGNRGKRVKHINSMSFTSRITGLLFLIYGCSIVSDILERIVVFNNTERPNIVHVQTKKERTV